MQWQQQNMYKFLHSQETPHISPFIGELWDVFCEDFGENWLCYNSTALYSWQNKA